MNKRLIPVAIIVGLGVIYGGYRLYVSRQPYEWSGTVEGRTIEVGSRAGGRVKEVKVREGAQVKAGDTLVVLEAHDLVAQRMGAEGQLVQAQANLEKMLKGARPEEIEQARARATSATAAFEQTRTGPRKEQIGAATARLAAQEVTVQKTLLDRERMRSLADKGAASRADLDNAEAAWSAAAAQRDALKQTLSELQTGTRHEEVEQAQARAREAQASARMVVSGSRIEDINAARGQVSAAEGKLEQIKVMIDELEIKAPRPARVEALDLRPGDILAPNATAAQLLEDDQLYVRIYVPETLIGKVRPGMEVPVTVDSFPGESFKGVIEHVSSLGEYSPRNLQTADERADQVFATRVGLREGIGKLRAGMAAFIKVPK